MTTTGTSYETTEASATGAYGFRINGLGEVSRHLTWVPENWPTITVERTIGPSPITRRFSVTDDWAEFSTPDQTGQVGGVRIDRGPPVRVTVTSPGGFSDAAALHPDLGLVAAIANRWTGRDTYHAGAFVGDGGTWAVTGTREAGKSSLLALTSTRGATVLADDAVAVDEQGRAYAGPRCIDLRESAARHLDLGEDIGMVGHRRRWRVTLPSAPATSLLTGWIVPEWGDRVEFESVPALKRMETLFGNRFLALPPPLPEQILALSGLPMVVFRRPRDWDSAGSATKELLDRLADLA